MPAVIAVRASVYIPEWCGLGQLEAPRGCNHTLKRKKCNTNTWHISKPLVWEEETLIQFLILPVSCCGPSRKFFSSPPPLLSVTCGMLLLVNDSLDSRFLTWKLSGSLAPGWVTSDPWCCGMGFVYIVFLAYFCKVTSLFLSKMCQFGQ